MRKFFLLFIILIGFNSVFAQISGTINGDTLRASLSPYHVTGDVHVDNLTIEPGVTLLFDGDFKFEVFGILKAEGLYSDSIYFIPAPGNTTGWKGLSLRAGSLSSTIKYCLIDSATDSGIKLDDCSPPVLSNCKITNSMGHGIELKKMQFEMTNIIVQNSDLNGLFSDDAQFVLRNMIIDNSANDGIRCNDHRDSLTVINSVIVNNIGAGISTNNDVIVDIKNSIIYYNTIELATGSNTTVNYSDVRGSSSLPGNGNINSPPQFEYDDVVPYSLIPVFSPCIDTGDPNPVYNDLYFPPSRGASPNDMGAFGGPLAGEWYPPLFLQPDTLNFGRVSFDSTKQLTLSIKNYRDTMVTADSIYFISNDTSVFSTTIDSLSLNVFDSTLVDIYFAPGRRDFFNGLVEFRTRNYGRVNVPIVGRGIMPEIGFTEVEIDFGTVALGDTSFIAFELYNSGDDTLRIYQIFTHSQNFTVSDSILKIMPGGTEDSLFVSFIPDSINPLVDSLILYTNDLDEGRLAFPLYGQGEGPIIHLNSASYNFGSVFLRSDSTLLCKIKNNGNDSLFVNEVLLNSLDSTIFSIVDTSLSFPQLIIPDDSFIVEVQYTPSTLGLDSAEIEIQSNDPFEPVILRKLYGTGIAPVINVNTSTIDFGLTTFNMQSLDSIIVRNLGNYNLILSLDSITISGVNPEYFNVENISSSQISPGDSAIVTLSYFPLSQGVKLANLEIRSNDPINSPSAISLRGESYAPDIGLSTHTLDFGNVIKDSVSYLTAMIFNNGLGDLVIVPDSLEIVGPDSNYFSIDYIEKYELGPSDSSELRIEFNPVKAAANQGALIIFSNDPDSHHVSISFSAFVLIPFIDLQSTVIDFGAIPLLSHKKESFFVYNVGYDQLTVYFDSLEITGTDSDYFKIDSIPSTNVIQPGDSSQVFLKYYADDAGTKYATLKIRSDDAVIPLVNVSLTGSSATPLLEISRTNFDFGTVSAYSNIQDELFIYNLGLGNLILYEKDLKITGNDSSSFFTSVIDSDIVILPQDSVEISIGLNTNAVGPKSAQLEIKSNDFNSPVLAINLSGLVIDNMPASVSIDQSHSNQDLIYHQNGALRFIVNTNFPTDSINMYYREGGTDSFNKYSCVDLGQSNWWEATIDSSWITTQGFEYYLRVYHGWTHTDWPNKPSSINVLINKLNFPFETKKSLYQMISLPFSTSNQTLEELFGDNLGTYNPELYRIFECTNGQDYTEISGMNKAMAPGNSLWLITKEEQLLDFTGAKTIDTDTTFQLSLISGWNMIATPFDFEVFWVPLNESNELWFYDGSGWGFKSSMEPYKGYATYVDHDTIISINPLEYSSINILAKSTITNSNWQINLKAEQNNLNDYFNFAGAKDYALNGSDQYDLPEPPPIGDYIALYFIEENKDQTKKKYAADYKSINTDGYVYDFVVEGNLNGKKSLTVESINLPENYRYSIINPATKIKYDQEQIQLYAGYNSLQLIVGTEEFVNDKTKEYNYAPVSYHLAQNYPNPFNPVTKIKYQVPDVSEISIDVYNILGQKVKTLLTNQFKEAGYYQIEWNGTNNNNLQVASGIYILNFRSKHYSKSIKMLLQR